MPKQRKHDAERREAETIKFAAEITDRGRAVRRHASLLVVQGADSDIGTLVVCDRPVTIGRAPDAELPLHDGSISRRHCLVEPDEAATRYRLVDLESTNGTRVNRTQVATPIPLAEGDKIFLGASVVKFGYFDGYDVDFHAKVESMVTKDELTGMTAKRRFDGAYVLALQHAREVGAALSLLVMDMDGLKAINDTHGHQFGSFAITEVAHVIQSVVDEVGDSCRYGGDEFMAFLPEHGRAAARELAERIRDGVERHRFEKDGVVLAPTISVGVAVLGEDADSADDLFMAADRALYRAKGAGKNRVEG